jgi:hypothetical protein
MLVFIVYTMPVKNDLIIHSVIFSCLTCGLYTILKIPTKRKTLSRYNGAAAKVIGLLRSIRAPIIITYKK